MPFRSKSQQAYLEIHLPTVAKRFAAETPKSAYKSLPQKASGQHPKPNQALNKARKLGAALRNRT
jgi:hypothetical protein